MKMRKALILAICLLCASINLVGSVFAWGGHGHRIVAMVAAERLSAKSKAAIAKLLGNIDLAAVANWADDVKFTTMKNTYNWHFVDIPKDETTYLPSRDCAATQKGDCAIAALDRCAKVLKKKKATKAQKADALRFIVHIIGDIHQPFHCIDNHGDLGGNRVIVTLNGKATHTGFGGKVEKYNLHEIWDNEIIESTALSDAAFVSKLDGQLSGQDESNLAQGNPTSWVEASHAVAQPNSIYVTNGTNIDAAYLAKTLPIVQNQLAKGGVRLAKYLNDIWGS